MITSFYAGLLAFVIVALSARVIRVRRTKKVRLGDGGEEELQAAIRAQGNAIEYIPIALILLLALENAGGHPAIIHAGGMAMVAGRMLHGYAILNNNLRFRIWGMMATFNTIVALALFNIGYFVYGQI